PHEQRRNAGRASWISLRSSRPRVACAVTGLVRHTLQGGLFRLRLAVLAMAGETISWREEIMRRLGLARIASSAALLLLCLMSPAPALDYPDKPIRVVLTYTAGGVSDGIMRLLAPKMEEMLGQKIIIEAKPGAAGNI